MSGNGNSSVSGDKRFAPACERNRDVILSVLQRVLPASGTVLEIGSGTGQHAADFAAALAPVKWWPTDLADNLASITAWAAETTASNILPATVLDLSAPHWPDQQFDALVCINTVHIIAWPLVQNLFLGAGSCLRQGAILYVYGPYRYEGRLLEPSNVKFDQWLKARDPESGIREYSAVNALAEENGFTLAGDEAMPANNRSIWWVKR